MNAAVTRQKAELRQELVRQRRALTPGWVREHSSYVQRRIRDLARVAHAASLGGYMAMPHEVQLGPLLDFYANAGKAVFVPAFDPSKGTYRMARYSPEMKWVRGKFDVIEPADPEWLEVGDLDVMLVPGLAYDAQGNRLGHGKGFYDHLLATFDGFLVGLAFDFQVVDAVPTDPHDIPMQAVVTQSLTYRRDGAEARFSET